METKILQKDKRRFFKNCLYIQKGRTSYIMEIEFVESKDKYSFSLWFDRELNTEYFMFCKGNGSVQDLQDTEKDNTLENIFKRNFGSILTDCFDFAQSDNIQAIKEAVIGLADIIEQGQGRDKYTPHKEKLFRIYNNSNNLAVKAVVLMVWYHFRVKHAEMYKLINSMSHRQWRKIREQYEAYIEKLLAPFENRISTLEDILNTECNLSISVAETDIGFVNIYTWQNDLFPLYIIYLPLLEMQKKNILACKECGKQFIAKRIDTQVCSDECKRKRQRGYNQKHTEKVNNEPCIIEYKGLRQRYFDFEKTLKANKAPKKLIYSCVDTRRNYEEEFDGALYQYKAGHNTMRAVVNCTKRYADKLDKMITAVGLDSGTEVTL